MYEIKTDDTLREIRQHGTMTFPFQHYHNVEESFAGRNIAWHWHKEFELGFVVRGAMVCLIGEHRIPLDYGDGLFINSGVIHRYEWGKNGAMKNILFAPELVAPAGSDIYSKFVQPIAEKRVEFCALRRSVPWQAAVMQELRHMYNLADGEDPCRELAIHTHICQMWQELYQHLEQVQAVSGQNIVARARMRLMLQFIQDHYAEKITLDDIASSANVSKSEALRCFRSIAQASPVSYLNEYRLFRARELLLRAGTTISDAALATGFDNLGYFDRVFRKKFGMTPRQFRTSVNRT